MWKIISILNREVQNKVSVPIIELKMGGTDKNAHLLVIIDYSLFYRVAAKAKDLIGCKLIGLYVWWMNIQNNMYLDWIKANLIVILWFTMIGVSNPFIPFQKFHFHLCSDYLCPESLTSNDILHDGFGLSSTNKS